MSKKIPKIQIQTPKNKTQQIIEEYINKLQINSEINYNSNSNKKFATPKNNIIQSPFQLRSGLRSGRKIKIKENEYQKKWDVLPKIINFQKNLGRYKENTNSLKIKDIQRMRYYNPSYKLIDKNFGSNVKFGKNDIEDYRNRKINSIRKAICNHLNILNNGSDNYSIINFLNTEKLNKIKVRNQRNNEDFKYLIKKNFSM